ncbi:MAG: ABC transporter ATP-binding protein [Aigarchaeota archaeon]|nr:ABC transporter ATP-binding protein [Candidatus Pelearchaeum maunauluense]
MTLLKVSDLRIWYPVQKGIFSRLGYVKAVDGVSFSLNERETLALVGESGSGKTTLGRATLGLIKPTAGHIIFDGKDLTKITDKKQLMEFRRKTAMIFQDPFSSLSPTFPVFRILEEPLIIHGVKSKEERVNIVYRALELVKLQPVELFAAKYPHMLSGGQRQRVAIARALILGPKYVVADEPVSMLDASVRVEILYLLRELQEKLGLAFLYITHDIATAKYFSHKIAVMYAGKIVEYGETREVLRNPIHPYTQALISTLPDPDPKNRFRMMVVIKGEPPNLMNPPSGCRFHPRCPFANEKCSTEEPFLREINEGHFVSCHYAGEVFIKETTTSAVS